MITKEKILWAVERAIEGKYYHLKRLEEPDYSFAKTRRDEVKAELFDLKVMQQELKNALR